MDAHLLAAYTKLRGASVSLMAEFELEEEEYGFPLNFALRRAHADLKQALRELAGHPAKP